MSAAHTTTAFHERHDDELLTLEEVTKTLKTSPCTVRWWSEQRFQCRVTNPLPGPSNDGGQGERRPRDARFQNVRKFDFTESKIKTSVHPKDRVSACLPTAPGSSTKSSQT